ncbi:MAG: helix-turn-helix transcriptional regulator [Gemmataceae bacterium]|nr:helix-turn-helix transcriptional regulator [Gemmataceae bacterium]
MDLKLAAGCYFGNRVHCRELAGFLLTDHNYRPGERIRTHYHERSYFSLIVAGEYAETYGNRSRECKTATVVFHPAGERHAEQIGEAGARTFNVEVETHWLGKSREYRAVLDTPADFWGGLLARLAFRLYQEFCRPDGFSPLAVEGLVLELVAERARCAPPRADCRPPWLVRALEMLHVQFAASLSLTGLAREVGVHPVHLARTFRVHCGCSVGEYLRQLRVEYASQRLAASDASLVEIALAAGFADQSHFTRTFQRLRGLTPATFRQLHCTR